MSSSEENTNRQEQKDKKITGIVWDAPLIKNSFEEQLAWMQEQKAMASNHKLDTDTQVFFYEQDYYVLSNFSAFQVSRFGHVFPTSEHAYQWAKFNDNQWETHNMRDTIKFAPSAHEAFKIAEANAAKRRPEWDAVKVNVMRQILLAKVEQHEYVRRKLLATGVRELIEDSWRDAWWGWGPDRNGLNMLGKLWMEIRAELRKESA